MLGNKAIKMADPRPSNIERIDNSCHALQRLHNLYQGRELCDLKLIVGHKEFHTHKLVLCMSSDVFRTMLTNDTWPEASKKRIVLQEDPNCAAVFGNFLRYLYRGQVIVHVSNVLYMLMLADKYNVADLSVSCLRFMRLHCSPDAEDYIISWQQYAILCGYRDVEDICRTYIFNNFNSIMHRDEFKNVSKEILLSFLESSDLVIKEEHALYSVLMAWVKHTDCTEEEHKNIFEEVMNHVRFPMMPLSQLAALEVDPMVGKFKEFYLNKLFVAMKYHASSMQARQQMIASSRNKLQFLPRNYLCDTWSTEINVDKFSSIIPGDVRGFFFTTPISCSEFDKDSLCDWHVDLYPKGVKFDSCVMIGVPRILQVAGAMYRNVRLSISPSCVKKRETLHGQRFGVSLLIKSSTLTGEEYVRKVVQDRPLFSDKSPLFNFNDIIPYDELTALISRYLVDREQLKIVIIIKPEH